MVVCGAAGAGQSDVLHSCEEGRAVEYFATAFVRRTDGWAGQEMDLEGVSDLSTLAERLRELDDAAATALLLIEEDDEYCAIVRVDGADDPRVFLSDRRAAATSRIAALLLAELELAEPGGFELPPALADDVGDPVADPVADAAEDEADDLELDEGTDREEDVEPVGDLDVASDLGLSARELARLCRQEGVLPADVISEVCERAGFLDELERLRERVG